MKVAAGIIEDGSGKILIAQRPAGKRLAGYWEFPGGKIEAGESGAEALKRELKEELELIVRVDEELGWFSHAYDWGVVELNVFRVHALSSARATEHIQEFQWIDPKEIDLETFAPADHAPLRKYRP